MQFAGSVAVLWRVPLLHAVPMAAPSRSPIVLARQHKSCTRGMSRTNILSLASRRRHVISTPSRSGSVEDILAKRCCVVSLQAWTHRGRLKSTGLKAHLTATSREVIRKALSDIIGVRQLCLSLPIDWLKAHPRPKTNNDPPPRCSLRSGHLQMRLTHLHIWLLLSDSYDHQCGAKRTESYTQVQDQTANRYHHKTTSYLLLSPKATTTWGHTPHHLYCRVLRYGLRPCHKPYALSEPLRPLKTLR
jgi:hypothetical protein